MIATSCCGTCRNPDCDQPVCVEDPTGCSHGVCEGCVCEDCRERRCGRIDNHQPHQWTRPALGAWYLTPAATYWCPGPPAIEGGARA